MITLFREAAPPPPCSDYGLSQQELQVYGYVNFAARLEITVNTVRNHIRSIYEKLHEHSASEAVAKALRKRIL